MKLITLSAAKKWGDFKHILTKEYLYMKEDKGQIRTQPPEEFPFIDKDTWAEFIKQRCTSEFQEISERNSELAKQNKYPFRSSRKSYVRIEEELLREQGLDPTNSSLPRCELWMAGRQTYNGNFDGGVVNVVRNIGSLKEQVSLGQISPEGREDILALALGKEEHAGRIRGVGAGVGVKKYFPENRHRNSSAASEIRINELQAKMEVLQQENASRDQLLEQLKSQLEFFQKNWMDTHGEAPPVQVSFSSNDNVSYSKTKSPSSHEPMDTWEECDLFWPDLRSKVAKGRVLVPQTGKVLMHHCQPLGSDKHKILVEDALMPNVVVPFPTEEVTSVLQAKDTPVVWPKRLVVILKAQNQNSECRKNPTPRQKKMDEDIHRHQQYATTLDKYRITYPSLPSCFLITIDVAKDILNYTQQLHVGKEQIRVCLQKDAMDNVHLALYMKYLYESRPSNIYAFFCPTYIADGYKDSEEKKERYMVDSMSEPEMINRIWFAAYNQGFHWMLAVINPCDNIVYWLDPLRKGVPDKFRAMVDTAITVLLVQKNKNNRRKTRWLNISCPEQEPNTLDCGYYVCRYMREIMDHKCTVIPINYFQDSPSVYRLMRYERNSFNIWRHI